MGLKIMFLDFIIIYLFLWFWNYYFSSYNFLQIIEFYSYLFLINIFWIYLLLIFTLELSLLIFAMSYFINNIFLLSTGSQQFFISYIFSKLNFTIINLLTIGLHLFRGLSPRGSYRIIFWKSIHLEVASGPFCLLVNSPWLLVFALVIILLIFTGFNIYCWAGIQFSSSNFIIFVHLFFGFIFSFHFWSRDLLREFQKKYEILLMVLFLLFGGFLASEALLFVSFFWASFHSLSSPTLGLWPGETFYIPDPCELTFANTLLLSNAAVSLGGAFVSLEISSQFYIFFALFSFCLSSLFISLQIKEFRVMALSINDSLYSCLFFFLTGLHFFHLTVGLFLLSLLFWGCSFPYKISYFVNLRVLEVHLFYNLQLL